MLMLADTTAPYLSDTTTWADTHPDASEIIRGARHAVDSASEVLVQALTLGYQEGASVDDLVTITRYDKASIRRIFEELAIGAAAVGNVEVAAELRDFAGEPE